MLHKSLVASGLVLSLSGAAQAATLFTPPLFPGNGDSFACELVNVSPINHIVQIQIIGDNGGVLSDSGQFTLPAGQSDVMSFLTAGALLHCQFVVEGENGDYRGSAAIFNNGGSDFVAVPAQ